MTRRPTTMLTLAAAVALPLLWLAAAAQAQVHDGAHLFSGGAVTDANSAIEQMQQRHNKGLVLETIPKVSDKNIDAARKDPAAYFKESTANRMQQLGVNGVYVLICMDPRYVEVHAGKYTAERGDFTSSDIDRVGGKLRSDLKAGNNDQALRDAIDGVEQAYSANIHGGGSQRSSVGRESYPAQQRPPESSGGGVPLPGPMSGGGHSGGKSMGIGALICLGVAALIIFSLIKSVFRRGPGGGGGFGGGGFGGGAGNYPTGGPTYGPGYGGPGYGGPAQTGGGGFGRGILGGLLGGAAGSYIENRVEHRNDSGAGQAGFPSGGDMSSGGFGGGGGGGSFDAGPSDAGQASDLAGGGDFGSVDSGGGGGGGDSGGGSF